MKKSLNQLFPLLLLILLLGVTNNVRGQILSPEKKVALLDSLSKNPSGIRYYYDDNEISEVEFYEKLYDGKLDNLSSRITGTGKGRKAVLYFGEQFRDGIIIYKSKEYETNKQNELNNRNDYIEDNHFVLDGVVSDVFNGKQIMLFVYDEETVLKVDTAVVNNGKFKFTGTEYLKDIAILSVGNYPDTVAYQILFLDKGNIKVDMNTGRVSGSIFNDMYQGYLDTIFNLDKELSELKSDEDGRKENEEGLFVIPGSPRHKKLIEMGEYSVGFKKENIHNAVGQYIFENEKSSLLAESYAYPSTETCLDSVFYVIYNAADDNLKQKKWVQSYIKSLNYWADLKKKEKQMVGKKYTDFALKDRAGNSRNISDYIGDSEYVLLDFWASWCGPCIASFPHLKNLYNSFDRDKIEIIGISIDDDTTAWDKAIEKEQIPWVQLITESSEITKKLMDDYSFAGIPNYVLLNREGEIISTDKTVNSLLNMIE